MGLWLLNPTLEHVLFPRLLISSVGQRCRLPLPLLHCPFRGIGVSGTWVIPNGYLNQDNGFFLEGPRAP